MIVTGPRCTTPFWYPFWFTMSDNEYWLVAVPGDPTPDKSWSILSEKIKSYSACFKYPIPDLKVGTLDTLVSLSDQLAKLDPFIENVVKKMALYMYDIIDPEDRDHLHDNLLVGTSRLPMETYVSRFAWDQAKFPLRQPLPGLVENISKMVSQIDGDLKQKSSSYNTLRGSLNAIERKEIGNLMTKSLNGLVKQSDVIVGSEYLQTLLVVVPKALHKEWLNSYESLTEMVVPRSTALIQEDQEFGLHTVTVFKKVVDEYKVHAREKRFIVRDYEYDPQAIEAEKKEKERLERDMKRQFGPLMNWLKVNFSQTFSAWVHLKALRVFTESVLRYGLPVNFCSVVLKPHRKAQKKTEDVLKDLYGYLDSKFVANEADTIDLPGLGFNQDYYPYVFFRMNLNVLEK